MQKALGMIGTVVLFLAGCHQAHDSQGRSPDIGVLGSREFRVRRFRCTCSYFTPMGRSNNPTPMLAIPGPVTAKGQWQYVRRYGQRELLRRERAPDRGTDTGPNGRRTGATVTGCALA